jgi:phage terminase small subunit
MGVGAMAKLSNKQRAFVEEYLRSWNATQAALAAGYSENTAYSQGHRLLKNAEIDAEIKRRLEELTMSETEVLARLTEQARGDIGQFFKVIEEWTEYPLPSHEVIDAKEVVEPADGEDGKSEKKTVYWVRHVAVDADKLVDPRYSHLVRKFKDSPKDGLTLELYDAQGALKLIGQRYGLFKDKVEVTGKDGKELLPLDDIVAALHMVDRQSDDTQ